MALLLQKSILDRVVEVGEQHILFERLTNRTAKHDNDQDLGPFFAYYNEQCIQALVDKGQWCTARTHQDIIELVDQLKAPGSRDTLLGTLRRKYATRDPPVQDEVFERTIDLAARVASMHELGRWRFCSPGRSYLDWNKGTVRECISSFYDASRSSDTGSVDSMFDIVALEQLAGIQVVWTDNLAEHLRLGDSGRTGVTELSIFHHATWLKSAGESAFSILPAGLAEETLTTLAVLFPHRDRVVKRWFGKKQSKEERPLDEGILTCGRLIPSNRQLEHFVFWGERLAELKQAFDEAEPGTLTQWWIDRRRKAQWSTFWVAVLVLLLTIFFGVVQCIEGGMQVYKAYHPEETSTS